MTFELLISALNADEEKLINTMRVTTNAVLVNQTDSEYEKEISTENGTVRVCAVKDRGVGKSRNLALSKSSADIVLFSDEDIVYSDDYEKKVLEAFEAHKDASVITFNFEVDERRRTYVNTDEHRITFKNYGRYPAYAIAVRREDIINNNINYSLLFGGGAKYSNGEDSLFLHDCLKKKLIMYSNTEFLGKETYRKSTWFEGYTDKFFFDRGVLYHFLYGAMANILGARFLLKNRKTLLKDKSFFKAYKLLSKGIREGKSI